MVLEPFSDWTPQSFPDNMTGFLGEEYLELVLLLPPKKTPGTARLGYWHHGFKRGKRWALISLGFCTKGSIFTVRPQLGP